MSTKSRNTDCEVLGHAALFVGVQDISSPLTHITILVVPVMRVN